MNNTKKALILLALAYVLAFIYYYPPMYGISDEQSYLRGAYLLKEGKLTVDNPFHQFYYILKNERYVPLYPPGQSLLLLPFTFFGWKATFLSGLLIHLLGAYIFYSLLKRCGYDTKGTVLYLLYPPFLFNSRTIMSDMPSAVIILGAFYFYLAREKKEHYISGILFGLACVFRYTNLLAFIPFALVSFLNQRGKFARLVSGFAPFALIILLYNNSIFGGPLSTGYSGVFDGSTFMSLSFLPNHLIKNILILAVMYPLMFFSPFFYKKEGRLEILLALFLFLMLYSIYLWPPFDIKLTALVGGVRFFIPIIPLLLLTYASFYASLLEKIRLPHNLPFIITGVLLLASVFVIFPLHQEYLNQRHAIFNEIHTKTPENSLIIGMGEDFMYLGEPFDGRGFADITSPHLQEHIKENDAFILVSFHHKGIEGFNDLEGLKSKYRTSLVGSTDEPYRVELYHIEKQ